MTGSAVMMIKLPIPSSEHIRPLPIRLQLADGESGIGYLYRLLHRNGLNLSHYRQLAGIDYRAFPDARHASLIAFLGGESSKLLESRLTKTVSIPGRKVSRLAMHQLSNAGHLRGRHPQVCIPCLYSTGISALAWEFAAVTCCPTHQVYLIDRCPRCHKLLTWERPDLTICTCGRYLVHGGDALDGPTVHELELAANLHAFVDHNQPCKLSTIPAWVGALSVDGISAFIRVFGLCTKPNQTFPLSRSFCRVGTDSWIALIKRAISRWIEPDSDPEIIRSWVNLPLLERFHTIYATSADHDTAEFWIKQLSGRLPMKPKTHKPIQGRLFQ